MGVRRTDRIVPAHAYCLLNPKGRLMVSTCCHDRIDVWERIYSETEWIEKQREGWRVQRVTVMAASDDKNERT